jgi:superfamily II DNA or RNA helicase
MEPASNLQTLPSKQNLRAGQEAVVNLFRSQTKVVAQLPTGYGKTLTAVCSYLELKRRIGVNRVLYIVPRGQQAQQAAEEVPRSIKEMVGESAKAFVVGDNPITALKAHRNGAAEVYVTTVQALVSSPRTLMTILEMMAVGRWFVVIDEHHHYGDAEDSVWTQKVLSLPASALLAMSATPNRSDGPSPLGDPDVRVTYLDAWREGAVKELRLHSYEYRVDAVNVNGDIIPFSTAELIKEVGSDNPAEIEKWMASRQMRWSPKYISPLILHPIERLLDLRMRNVRGQMIVQALSCSHAKMVCDQVKALTPQGMRVDWVGTGPNGRTDTENECVLREFCPEKDAFGRRRWSLDILVNVGIAGEGLDTTDVCEVVFLTSPNITNSALQTIGRGARTIRGLHEQPACIVNVDGACEFAPHIGQEVMSLFDGDVRTEDERELERESGSEGDDYDPLPDTITVGILDVTLLDIRTDPMYQGVLALTEAQARKSGLTDEQAKAFVESAAEHAVREYMRQRDERFNASAIEAQTRDKLRTAVNKVAGLIVRRMTDRTGMRLDRSFIGDIVKRINSQKKRALGAVEAAGVDELQRHYHWIKQLEAQVLSGGAPEWLR